MLVPITDYVAVDPARIESVVKRFVEPNDPQSLITMHSKDELVVPLPVQEVLRILVEHEPLGGPNG